MSKNIIREWNFWLASILTGACMAFLYDILRLLRRLVRHGRIAVDLEDIAYWSVCFGASFVLLYYGNNGVIRFAAVVGAAAGMAVYAATAGRVLIKAGYFVIDRAKKFIFYQKCRLTGAAFRRKIYSRRKTSTTNIK